MIWNDFGIINDAKLMGAVSAFAPTVFLPYPRITSTSQFFEWKLPWNSPPHPLLHPQFSAPIGTVGDDNCLPANIWFLHLWFTFFKNNIIESVRQKQWLPNLISWASKKFPDMSKFLIDFNKLSTGKFLWVLTRNYNLLIKFFATLTK